MASANRVERGSAERGHPNDADAALGLLGPRGHLALEVHDNDPVLGRSRWGLGAACRWRNLRVRELG